MKKCPVIHFEMPYKKAERVVDFYTKVFGWEMAQLGEEMGNYVLAGTTPVDENQMAINPGTTNGGFFEYKEEEGFNSPHVVIQVDNLDESIEAVKKAGGEITSEKMEIKGIGTYVSLKDTEENTIGMLQPLKQSP